MAKLYWRLKDKETGKWKWVAATNFNTTYVPGNQKCKNLEYQAVSK